MSDLTCLQEMKFSNFSNVISDANGLPFEKH
jgi:hypothetical protein